MKKRLLSTLLVGAMSLSLVACGGNEAASTTAAATTAAAAETKAPEVKVVEAGKIEDAEYAKEITMTGFGFDKLDPTDGWNAGYEAYERLVFDTLIMKDEATGEYINQLAETIEWDNEECSRIHVVLRDDIVFSNGEKLTSADAAFSFDRQTYGQWASNYKDCEIVSDTELYINLEGPCSAFFELLCTACGMVTCKAEAEANPDGLAIIGSGPYKYDMDSYVVKDSITLERNEHFWGEANPTEKFHIVTLSDHSASVVALKNGEINFMINVPETEIPILQETENVEIQTYDSYNFVYLGFSDNKDTTALTEEEINFRRAVACAINKEDIAAGLGGGQPMTSMYLYDKEGYIANESDYEHDLSYNPEKAKEYLAKAGGKIEFTILCDTASSWRKIPAEIIQEQLRQVGITMNIEETDSAGFTAATKWDTNEVEAQVHSNLFVNEVVNFSYYTPNNNVNRVLLNNPEIVELVDQIKASDDKEANEKLYTEIQTKIHDTVSWLPLVFREMNFAYTKGLENFTVTPSPTYQIRGIRLRTN